MLIEVPEPKTEPLYVKVPNFPGLYRHAKSERYYGSKKVMGKRREVSLRTTDRKIAERRMREWVTNLSRVNGEVERIAPSYASMGVSNCCPKAMMPKA